MMKTYMARKELEYTGTGKSVKIQEIELRRMPTLGANEGEACVEELRGICQGL